MRVLFTNLLILALELCCFGASSSATPPKDPISFDPPRSLGPVETYGDRIQRTMTLLATSTPEKRNTVKVLFYGQSITEQDWWKIVADDLRKRFPDANLIIENRAIGGFSSQILWKTAETDLYPFYPDLMIFHVYGSHTDYEDIIRRTRERTTAEILIQTDHLSRADRLDEPTDPSQLNMRDNWAQWFNYVFLPGIAKKYQVQLTNQRDLWKEYLRDYQLEPGALLRDGVHLNDHGCYLMAEIVKAQLHYQNNVPNEYWKDWATDYVVGRDVQWQDGKLSLDFTGNRVDVVLESGEHIPVEVLIDGKKPSEFPELYATTRTTSFPKSIWPCLLRTTSETPRIEEEWTLTLKEVVPDMSSFTFDLAGSITGPDGEGERGKKFVSNSGRVVIEPEDWNLDYAYKVFQRSVGDGFEIRWQVKPLGVDMFTAPAVTDPAIETTVTLAQGLSGDNHLLELSADSTAPITALRVYRPPLMESAGKLTHTGKEE